MADQEPCGSRLPRIFATPAPGPIEHEGLCEAPVLIPKSLLPNPNAPTSPRESEPQLVSRVDRRRISSQWSIELSFDIFSIVEREWFNDVVSGSRFTSATRRHELHPS